jgi:hypothetical protein
MKLLFTPLALLHTGASTIYLKSLTNSLTVAMMLRFTISPATGGRRGTRFAAR